MVCDADEVLGQLDEFGVVGVAEEREDGHAVLEVVPEVRRVVVDEQRVFQVEVRDDSEVFAEGLRQCGLLLLCS